MIQRRLWKVGAAILGMSLAGCASHQSRNQDITPSQPTAVAPISAPKQEKEPVESLALPLHAPVDSSKQKTVRIAIIDEMPPPQKTARPDITAFNPPPRIHIPSAKEDVEVEIAKNAKIHQKSGRRLSAEAPLVFDIPVAYNTKVKYWIEYFQTQGRPWFTKWLERSTRYLPSIQKILKQHGLPKDLAYMAMIESGFSPYANSHAAAVGPWQFIRETGNRYGLKTSWWIDERRDFEKSSHAAARYLKRLYGMFNSWYLVAAAYNTGENRVKRQIEKHGTRNYWKLSTNRALMEETKDYVPKMIAAMLISKSPQLYGFKHISWQDTLEFEHFRVPGGTNLNKVADALGVTPNHMRELNPELVRGYVAPHIEGHLIRIPKGSSQLMARYIRRTFLSSNN